MQSRITFLAGLAVGYVVGARAGRERYEQMVKLSRKVIEHPAVQQTTRTAGATRRRGAHSRRACDARWLSHLPFTSRSLR